jgi:exopolysaccharide production protein ExoZ
MRGTEALQVPVWEGPAAPVAGAGRLTLTSLQYLRGIAALMVVYFHSVLQLRNLGGGQGALPLFGESGVDLFFVLSGLLMWLTTANSRATPWAFMRKRLIRIAPLYWGLTLAAGAVALAAPSLLKSTVWEASHFFASLLFIPAPNPAFMDAAAQGLRYTPVIIPGWTLNYEMFFYLVFALCIVLKPVARLLLVPGVFVALWLAGAAGLVQEGPLAYYSNPIIFEFVLGMGVALLLQRRWFLAPWCAALAGVVAAVALVYADLHHAPWRPLSFGVPAAVLIYCLCSLESRACSLELPVLRLLGDASYSIYLTHVFSLAALRVVFLRVSGDAGPSAGVFLLVAIVVSALVGIATYWLYERPAMHLLERFK